MPEISQLTIDGGLKRACLMEQAERYVEAYSTQKTLFKMVKRGNSSAIPAFQRFDL